MSLHAKPRDRLYRIAQRERVASAWLPVHAENDAELFARGYSTAGPVLDMSGLPDDERTATLERLRTPDKRLSPADRARLAATLAALPRGGLAPPLDLDVHGLEPSPALEVQLLDMARRLDATCRVLGLGSLRWYRSSGGGLHGHPRLPADLWHPLLVRALERIVRSAAAAAAIPLLGVKSAAPGGGVATGPVLDTGTFRSGGRGMPWALVGSSRQGQQPKHLEPALSDLGPERFPANREAIETAIRTTEAHDAAERSGFSDRVALAPDEPGAGPLPTLAAAIAPHIAPGARHNPRLAIAGWLLRRGVPEAAVAATLAAAAADPEDARKTTATTARRLEAGIKCQGLGALRVMLGLEVAAGLEQALLDDAGAEAGPRHRKPADHAHAHAGPAPERKKYPRHPNRQRREFFEDAQELAAEGSIARNLRRAARCGRYADRGDCPACGKNGITLRLLPTESPACPGCLAFRLLDTELELFAAWAAIKLEHIAMAHVAGDGTPDGARAARAAARKVLGPAARRVRYVVGVSGVMILAIAEDLEALKLVDPQAKVLERAEACPAIAAHLRKRLELIEALVDARDKEGIAAEPWVGEVISTTYGVQGRTLIPWPGRAALRGAAKNRAQKARQDRKIELSPCCAAPLARVLVDRDLGEELAWRQAGARPFTYQDVREALGERRARKARFSRPTYSSAFTP